MMQSDLFPPPPKPPRRVPRVLAHVEDAGYDAILFRCSHCGWSSDWIAFVMTMTEAKRGIPCPNCNDKKP